jgi:tripartite-type tricarboxylate transporter receptor subunit TctC
MKRGLFFVILSSILGLALFGLAFGAEFPTKPVNILIGYSAGGSTDLSTRALAAEVSKTLKQPMICSNQVGAAGTLVLGRVKGEKADGYMGTPFITPPRRTSAASLTFRPFPMTR